jgi:hypothetical protein
VQGNVLALVFIFGKNTQLSAEVPSKRIARRCSTCSRQASFTGSMENPAPPYPPKISNKTSRNLHPNL